MTDERKLQILMSIPVNYYPTLKIEDLQHLYGLLTTKRLWFQKHSKALKALDSKAHKLMCQRYRCLILQNIFQLIERLSDPPRQLYEMAIKGQLRRILKYSKNNACPFAPYRSIYENWN